MIRGQNLSVRYPGAVTALAGVDLQVEPGEFVWLTGPSGAGKSTLLHLLAGLVVPHSGTLEVAGTDLRRAGEARRRAHRRRIGLVAQEFRLVRHRPALENVELGLRVLGMGGRQLQLRAQEALHAVGLGAKGHQRLDALSWGEQQRVALARALARQPQLILADEPTGNLDEHNAQLVFSLLKQAQERGATVVVATHVGDWVRTGLERTIQLEQGRIVHDRDPRRTACRGEEDCHV